ncbi:MAG: hypothetical protein KA795_04855 [Burkholderiaceae bacterium]|nr:hypothetical protein [Burkholderiaceae bacterium]
MDEPDWNRTHPCDDTAQTPYPSVRERAVPDAFGLLAAQSDGARESGLSEVWDYLGKH